MPINILKIKKGGWEIIILPRTYIGYTKMVSDIIVKPDIIRKTKPFGII
jgi:hypothetical protein